MADKQIVAVSRAEYRGETIFQTEDGFSVVLNDKQFNCDSLGKATSLIDAHKMLEALKTPPGAYMQ